MSEIQPSKTQTPNLTLFPTFMESEPLLDNTRINDTIGKS